MVSVFEASVSVVSMCEAYASEVGVGEASVSVLPTDTEASHTPL